MMFCVEDTIAAEALFLEVNGAENRLFADSGCEALLAENFFFRGADVESVDKCRYHDF